MLNTPTPEKTITCPKCSNPELGVKDKFCSSCGSAVPVVEEQVEEESVDDSQEEETEQVVENEEEEEEVVKDQSNEGDIEKVVRVIRIIRQSIGRIIGTGGQNINEVQDISGARIDVGEAEDEMNKITITGTEKSVNQAVSMVKQLATGRPKSWGNDREYRQQKQKPLKEYDETAELFGLNPYKRGLGRGRGSGNYRGSSDPPFMGSREPPFIGSREPPFMGSKEPPFMNSRESNMERAKWGRSRPDPRDNMSMESPIENNIPSWLRKSFRTGGDGWNTRSRPSTPGGFNSRRGDFGGGRDLGGDDFVESRGWGGASKESGWVTTIRRPGRDGGWGPSKTDGGWGPSKMDGGWRPSKTDGVWGTSKTRPKPKRDETAELFGISQPPPEGQRRWTPYRREALGRRQWP